MAKKILKEKKVTLGEVLGILSKEESIGQFQQRVLDYVKKMAKVEEDRGRKLVEELLKLGDITEDEAVQIVNIMPRTKEELKSIFYYRRTIVMEKFLEKILKIIHSS